MVKHITCSSRCSYILCVKRITLYQEELFVTRFCEKLSDQMDAALEGVDDMRSERKMRSALERVLQSTHRLQRIKQSEWQLHVNVSFGSVSQNVLKSDLEKSRICPMLGQSDPIWCQTGSPWLDVVEPFLFSDELTFSAHFLLIFFTFFPYFIHIFLTTLVACWCFYGTHSLDTVRATQNSLFLYTVVL